MVIFLNKYKNLFKIFVFIFLFLSSLYLLQNRLQYNITKSHEDDVHTMNMGIQSMYSGEVSTLRVGESTRWLARIIYPVAMYYMNSNMGGEHYVTGWNYPGGFYIQKHFKSPDSVKEDANLQDFVFAMKFILGSLVLLTFIVASFMITKRYNFISGISYFIFSISTAMIINMLDVFYTESTLVIIFNLLIVFALLETQNKWRIYIWLAFLFAFAVSTKLTGLIFLLPIIAIIISKDINIFSNMKIEGFFILVCIFYLLINIFASSYMSLLDQTLSNVYHLKTGHLNTVPSGFYQLKIIIKTLSPWIFIFPLAVLFLIFNKQLKNKIFIFSVIFASVLIILSQVNVSMSLPRNLTNSLIMIIFIISISFGLFYSYLVKKYEKLKKKDVLIFTSLLLILGYFYMYNLNKHIYDINPDSVKKSLSECKNIATIDVEKGYIENATILPSMPDTFNLKQQQDTFRNLFATYDCVVIKKVKNNKHFTNYILPLDYKLNTRVGKYFVFKNNQIYQNYIEKQNNVKKLKELKSVASSKFNIYIIENKLVLNKDTCNRQDIEDTFFFHIVPDNVSDIPENRQQYKFDNLDFKASINSLFGNSCYIERDLPKYKFNSIRIGQFNKQGQIWQENIDFKEIK